jgi:hypothetical protein
MAVAPVFYSSRELLLQALRLDKSCPGAKQELLDQIIMAVRSRIFSCFGTARIAEIKSVLSTEDPITEDQYRRSTAETMEFRMASKEAYLFLSATLIDGGAANLAEWGSEAPYLVASPEQRLHLTDRLEKEIQQNIEALGGCGSQSLEPTRVLAVSTNNPHRPLVGRSWRDF